LLTFHFLNVNHGDSIVIEYQNDIEKVFGVIDSNIVDPHSPPPALEKLKSLGAKKLSFIALTHPHADHYSGLSQIIDYYKNNISNFYSFPLDAFIPGRLKDIAKIYQKIHDNVDSPTLKRTLNEFVKILLFAKKYIGLDKWQEPNGCDNKIAPEGFKGVSISVILPHPRYKGPYFQMIEQQSDEIIALEQLNNLSMAFQITYGDFEIILGGDGTNLSWSDHIKYSQNRGIQFGGDIVKLPHHGSHIDCTKRNIKHLFKDGDGRKIACISANGRSHPHPDIFKILSKIKIDPYCTNLSKICGANIKEFEIIPEITPVLNRFICSVGEPGRKGIQPCQGDITINIHKNGHVEVTPQYNNMCQYRGDFDFLMSEL